MIVDTDSEGAPVHRKGQQLIVHELPERFQLRYGKIPQKIFVRECYRELYETVSALMLRQELDFAVTLFTGVPGIGKSMFLVYFIYRFLHDGRFVDKLFAIEFHQGEYACFQPTADATEFTYTTQNGIRMQTKQFLLLCDINNVAEPVSRAKWTYIFSSPAPARYKEILKNFPTFKYTMPTWSEQELMFAMDDRDLWYGDFVIFGGVPRLVIPIPGGGSSHALLNETLAVKGGAIAEAFFKFSFGAVDLLQSYMLIHINPPVSSDGNFKYDGETLYSFASDDIFQRLVGKHNAQMLAGAVGMFNIGAASETYGAVSAGNLFEKICLWLKPLDGQLITAAALGNFDNVTIDVPADRHMLLYDWKKTGQLPVNALILPRISNLESGDAFCVVKCGSHFRLVIFQITVGKSQPVKVNGLLNILRAFPKDVTDKITQKLLVFVIPKHGALNAEQTLHTQKGKESVVMPDIVRGFQQYVYRHEI